MTSLVDGGPSLPSEFNEKMDLLVDELSMAINLNCPGFILALTQSAYVETKIKDFLGGQIEGLPTGIVSLSVDRDPTNVDLAYFQNEIHEISDCILSIDVNCRDLDMQAGFLAVVMDNIGILRQSNVQLLLWLRNVNIRDLVRRVPELWYRRNCCLEFSEPGEEEFAQLLSAPDVECEEKPINEVESSLHEISENDEDLNSDDNGRLERKLLELGILEWRAGRYDKSLEYLDQALRYAYEFQDDSFESQCLNAIGLVYAWTSRFEEAIAVYKKSLQIDSEQLHIWNNLASLCLKIGRKDEALAAFLKAIENDPNDAVAWNGIGQVYHALDFFDSAISAFKKSASLAPAYSEPWSWLGDVYSVQGRYEEAIRSYQKAVQLHPNMASQSIQLARALFKSGRLEDAKKVYRQVLKLDPQNSEVLGELGLVYLDLSDDFAAEEILNRSILCDPLNGKSHGSMGLLYIKQGRLDDGICSLLKAIELLPDGCIKADVFNNLGDAYRCKNEYAEAVTAYENADMLMHGALCRHKKTWLSTKSIVHTAVDSKLEQVSCQSEDIPAASSKPKLIATIHKSAEESIILPADQSFLRSKKKLDKEYSLEILDDLQSMSLKENYGDDEMIKAFFAKLMKPTEQFETESNFARNENNTHLNVTGDPAVWTERGNHFFAKSELEKADAAYQRAIELDGSFGWAYCNTALVCFMQGKHIDALAFYTRALDLLKLDTEKAVCWNGLGNVYRRIGNYEKALDAFQQASILDPLTSGIRDGADAVHASAHIKKAVIRNGLGELFLNSGETEDALIAFKSAVEMDPANPEYLNNLAGVMASLGNYHEAIETYKHSLELSKDNKSKAAIWNRIGNAFRKLKNYDGAVQAYQKAVALGDEKVSLLTRARFSLLSNS